MSKLPAQEFELFINTVLDETDEIARGYFNNHGEVEAKADATPVTEADKHIEQLIRQKIEATHPEHSIIGEEGEDKQTASPYQWVIDPIDGTKAFIAGKPTFTTLIGLLYEGVPSYGAVSQPIAKERWSAAEAYKPEGISDATPAANLAEINIATTSEGYFSAPQLQAIEKMKQQGATISYGGDAYAYMILTESKLDAVFDVGLKPHDIIPLLPILQQAGVWVGFFENGQAIDKISNNVVAAKTPDIGRALRSQLLG